MSAMGGKRTFPAFRLSEFSLANDVGSQALDAALAVVDRKSIRVFEAVNFVDGTPFIVLFDLIVGPDGLTGVSRVTDCTRKIAEAQVAMRLH